MKNTTRRRDKTNKHKTHLRVGGGTCPRCSFEMLPNGKCGVCFQARRVGLECVEFLDQEPTLAAIAIWEDE